MRLFQLPGAGSQTSMPIPGEVDGAPAGPGLPGPTSSLTMQTSLVAVGVVDVAAPLASNGSPFLNALTSNTLVLASGANPVFIVSLQDRVAGTAGISGVIGSLDPVSYTHLTLPTTPYV